MFNFNKKNKAEKQEQEQLQFDDIKKQNEELYKQLTNKNKNYMFQLNARLEALDYSPVKKEYVFNEMLQEIIEAQSASMTARKVYGTITEQADNILGKNVIGPVEEEEKSPTWQLYVDGALLAGGMFNLISGFSAMQEAATLANQVRLFQLIFNFLLGGLAVMILTKYAPRRGESKGLLKYAMATVVVVVGWALLSGVLVTIIPVIINPVIPGVAVMIIGALALIGKWQFKKIFDVKGTLF